MLRNKEVVCITQNAIWVTVSVGHPHLSEREGKLKLNIRTFDQPSYSVKHSLFCLSNLICSTKLETKKRYGVYICSLLSWCAPGSYFALKKSVVHPSQLSALPPPPSPPVRPVKHNLACGFWTPFFPTLFRELLLSVKGSMKMYE